LRSIALGFPVLYGPLICLRFEDGNKPGFDIFFRAKLKTSHPAKDLSFEVISAQRFASQEVRIGCPIEATGHPGVTKEIRE
jgi:hypothetical protein